jgi:hypothetical protein
MGNLNEGPVESSSNAPNPKHDLVEKLSRMFEIQVERQASVVSQAFLGMTTAEDSPRLRMQGDNIGVKENVNASGPEGRDTGNRPTEDHVMTQGIAPTSVGTRVPPRG